MPRLVPHYTKGWVICQEVLDGFFKDFACLLRVLLGDTIRAGLADITQAPVDRHMRGGEDEPAAVAGEGVLSCFHVNHYTILSTI